MATIPSYEALDFYDKRLDLTGQDFVLAYSKEFWFQELELGSATPSVKTITVDNAASPVVIDSEVIPVTSDVAVRLFRGDVLKFGPTLVVITATTLIDGTATPTNLPVLSTSAEIPDTTTAITYALVPYLSLQDGGDLENTGTEAVARNKTQGLYPAKRTTERDGTINVSGALYVSDPGAILMEDLSDGSRNIYYEIRWAPYQAFTDQDGNTVAEGAGPGARVGVATIQAFSVQGARSEFATATGTLGMASRPDPYVPLAV